VHCDFLMRARFSCANVESYACVLFGLLWLLASRYHYDEEGAISAVVGLQLPCISILVSLAKAPFTCLMCDLMQGRDH
jgi:hypothetical protein